MSLTPLTELREVQGISESDKIAIKNFMQGAIYCWAKNRRSEPFAVRDLMGGENFSWEGTPLQVLYDRHITHGKSNDRAIESAAQDLGWLVKSVLAADKRTFEAAKDGLVSSYRWVGGEA